MNAGKPYISNKKAWLIALTAIILWPFISQLLCYVHYQAHPELSRYRLEHDDFSKMIAQTIKHYLNLFSEKRIIFHLLSLILPILAVTFYCKTVNWRKNKLKKGERSKYIWGTISGGIIAICVSYTFFDSLEFTIRDAIGYGLAMMSQPIFAIGSAFIGICVGYISTRIFLDIKNTQDLKTYK